MCQELGLVHGQAGIREMTSALRTQVPWRVIQAVKREMRYEGTSLQGHLTQPQGIREAPLKGGAT